MIRTITIGGEHGSGREEIGRLLAEKLGWALFDSSLIGRIATMAHVDPEVAKRFDECIDPWLHRVQKALWRGGYEGVVTTTESDIPDADVIAGCAQCVIESAAREGNCVIVGRGGQCTLQEDTDAFHVFIYAPRVERAERLRRELGPGADVEAVMDATDHTREAYIRRRFGQDWTNRHLYDMMICSSMGEPAVVEAIRAAVRGS
jgi:cytidylate kinase